MGCGVSPVKDRGSDRKGCGIMTVLVALCQKNMRGREKVFKKKEKIGG